MADVGRREAASAALQSFAARRAEVEKRLGQAVAGDSLHADLDALVAQARELGSDIHDASQDLASYDLQQQMAAVRSLEEQIARKREELAPKQKFSFRRKPKKEGEPVSTAPAVAAPKPDGADVGAGMGDAVVVEGRRGEKVVLQPQGRDAWLKDLQDCEVHLLDAVGAVRAHNLQRCVIWAPAVQTSCLLYSCRATVFVLVAQQLRLHDSEHLELYLHTTASPVVEGCKEVAFGPYPMDAVWDGQEQHWADGRPCPREEDRTWSQVLDFHWHKTTPSPHWRLAEPAPAAEVLSMDAAARLAKNAEE